MINSSVIFVLGEPQWKKEARLPGEIQLADWNVVLALNRRPCFKGRRAAGDCFRLAVHSSPLNIWKDTGQVGRTREGEQFGGSPEFPVCSSCSFMHFFVHLCCVVAVVSVGKHKFRENMALRKRNKQKKLNFEEVSWHRFIS